MLTGQAKPRIRIASAQVSDGTTLTFSGGEIVVFVGPNNAGKSAALRNIEALLR
jgi:ABC-type hemin transport system ATPase subunit